MSSAQEISQREAILRRLRGLLEKQRQRFQDYLQVLDSQQQAVESDNIAALEQQVELETSVLEQILETQKTIAPLEGMYREMSGGNALPADIAGMQRGLTDMRSRISYHNNENRTRLALSIERMRTQIAQLRVPNRHSSPYGSVGGGQMVDIHG